MSNEINIKPEVVMNESAKPESGLFLFWARVEALCPPSVVCSCTSERAERQCDAYAIESPALRFRGISFAPLCGDVSFRGLSAKPESGRFLFWVRGMPLCPPSGVCSCTSERTERQCDAYAIESPALRFRLLN